MATSAVEEDEQGMETGDNSKGRIDVMFERSRQQSTNKIVETDVPAKTLIEVETAYSNDDDDDGFDNEFDGTVGVERSQESRDTRAVADSTSPAGMPGVGPRTSTEESFYPTVHKH